MARAVQRIDHRKELTVQTKALIFMSEPTRYLIKHRFIFGGKNRVGARFTHVMELAKRAHFWRESLC